MHTVVWTPLHTKRSIGMDTLNPYGVPCHSLPVLYDTIYDYNIYDDNDSWRLMIVLFVPCQQIHTN